MGKKYTYKQVKKIFEDRDCELLQDYYVGCDTKMKFLCSCGEEGEIDLYHFHKRGQYCKKCAGKRIAEKLKFSYKKVKKIFEKGGCILISKIYKGNREKLKYICNCEEEAEITLSEFMKGGRCKKCGIKKCANKRRYSYKEVKEIFEKGGCILISKTYKESHDKLEYICNCEEEAEITLSEFIKGGRCNKCAGKRAAEKLRYSYKEIEEIFEKAECELLSKSYKKNNDKLEFICKCGRESDIIFSIFLMVKHCRECGKEQRSGKNHWHYNFDKTDEERIIERNYPEYIKWRKDVYERDNYSCQVCGDNKGGNLIAHHLESYDINIELRTVVSNGITIDENCHDLFHKIYGYGNNTTAQFEEFLSNNRIFQKSLI